MYNWSIDEKKFKNIKEIINFLKKQPEVISIRKERKKDRWGNLVIKVMFDLDTHLARKSFVEHYLGERMGNLHISIVPSVDVPSVDVRRCLTSTPS